MPSGDNLKESSAKKRAAIAKLGGEKIKEKYGASYFKELGQRGGKATRKKHGRKHYVQIATDKK